MEYKHIPVMKKEALEYLEPRPGKKIIDCTLGGGGYAFGIAKMIGPEGKVLAIDADELAIKNAEKNIAAGNINNVVLAHGNFRDLQSVVKAELGDREIKFDGIVFDLGLSSAQLDDRSRGFSFKIDAPLDMAFGSSGKKTGDILNKSKKEELRKILKEYGEEKYAGRIAEAIIKSREGAPIKTTKQLVGIISEAVPAAYRAGKIHFATRSFQALRIATNEELKSLEAVLPQAVELLEKGGRVVVVSYHSLEDRIVKRFFKNESLACLCPPRNPICVCGHKARLKILTKKPVIPKTEEVEENPRARSAKLRAAEKI